MVHSSNPSMTQSVLGKYERDTFLSIKDTLEKYKEINDIYNQYVKAKETSQSVKRHVDNFISQYSKINNLSDYKGKCDQLGNQLKTKIEKINTSGTTQTPSSTKQLYMLEHMNMILESLKNQDNNVKNCALVENLSYLSIYEDQIIKKTSITLHKFIEILCEQKITSVIENKEELLVEKKKLNHTQTSEDMEQEINQKFPTDKDFTKYLKNVIIEDFFCTKCKTRDTMIKQIQDGLKNSKAANYETLSKIFVCLGEPVFLNQHKQTQEEKIIVSNNRKEIEVVNLLKSVETKEQELKAVTIKYGENSYPIQPLIVKEIKQCNQKTYLPSCSHNQLDPNQQEYYSINQKLFIDTKDILSQFKQNNKTVNLKDIIDQIGKITPIIDEKLCNFFNKQTLSRIIKEKVDTNILVQSQAPSDAHKLKTNEQASEACQKVIHELYSNHKQLCEQIDSYLVQSCKKIEEKISNRQTTGNSIALAQQNKLHISKTSKIVENVDQNIRTIVSRLIVMVEYLQKQFKNENKKINAVHNILKSIEAIAKLDGDQTKISQSSNENRQNYLKFKVMYLGVSMSQKEQTIQYIFRKFYDILIENSDKPHNNNILEEIYSNNKIPQLSNIKKLGDVKDIYLNVNMEIFKKDLIKDVTKKIKSENDEDKKDIEKYITELIHFIEQKNDTQYKYFFDHFIGEKYLNHDVNLFTQKDIAFMHQLIDKIKKDDNLDSDDDALTKILNGTTKIHKLEHLVNVIKDYLPQKKCALFDTGVYETLAEDIFATMNKDQETLCEDIDALKEFTIKFIEGYEKKDYMLHGGLKSDNHANSYNDSYYNSQNKSLLYLAMGTTSITGLISGLYIYKKIKYNKEKSKNQAKLGTNNQLLGDDMDPFIQSESTSASGSNSEEIRDI